MTSLAKYRGDINSLASQLHKLLKVIRHSDPSASELKHLLYDKYRKHLVTTAKQVKEHYQWDDFRDYLLSQADLNGSQPFDDSEQVIKKKLVNDFEKEFVAKHVLAEFSSPDPEEIRRQREIRKREKAIKANRVQTEEPFTKEKIMDMVQAKQKQRQGRSNLQSLIAAIRKIDPQKIEIKISQSIENKPNS